MSSIPTRAQATGGAAVRAAGWVAPLCWIAVLLDGFDLVVVGTVVPTLSQPGEFALIGAVASFSLFTLLCAFAPSEVVFGILRLLAGLGLGGCLPTAIAMVNEFTRSGRSGHGGPGHRRHPVAGLAVVVRHRGRTGPGAGPADDRPAAGVAGLPAGR